MIGRLLTAEELAAVHRIVDAILDQRQYWLAGKEHDAMHREADSGVPFDLMRVSAFACLSPDWQALVAQAVTMIIAESVDVDALNKKEAS
jgi:hypothetical protein